MNLLCLVKGFVSESISDFGRDLVVVEEGGVPWEFYAFALDDDEVDAFAGDAQ